MTTAAIRTPRLGERWYFRLKGKVVCGHVTCVERKTAAYSSPVKQIHIWTGHGRKEFRIPPAKLFSSHSDLSGKPNKLSRVKLGPFDRGMA